jgi:hypothetical protein
MMTLACVLWASLIGMDVTVAEKFPTVGKETVITLSEPVDELAITYQPDAPVARTVRLATNGALEVPWVPAKAGVVKIAAVNGDGVAEVSVKFDGTPMLGVVIFIVAGIILFGGASLSMYSIFARREEEAELPEARVHQD